MKTYRKSSPRPKKNTLVVGPSAVRQALEQGPALDRIYLDTKLQDANAASIRKLAAENGVPVLYVPAIKLANFNAGEHGGCIAQKSRVQYSALQDVISQTVESGQAPLFLILDGITDIRNIGGIARTAYCAGVHALIIPERGVGALQEDAILTSAGALEKIAVCREPSLLKAVDTLHLNGIQVLAAAMRSATQVASVDLTLPVAIVLGSEDKGIYPALQKQCDLAFSIPMQHDFESLNVSVAAGMILYEAMKQRLK
ncbi:MAG: 23S rRNA (guanosine(2251)-2'-O)-methyltransferase RlmB [Sphingomonadales bacterium]